MAIRIGKLAKIANCQVGTIRFYEKEGLISASERSHSNYRMYDGEALDTLRFILHCRKHGLSLKDIRQLLHLREHPGMGCGFAHELVANLKRKVEMEIQSLQSLKRELEELQVDANCDGQCVILDKLQASDGCPLCEQLSPDSAP